MINSPFGSSFLKVGLVLSYITLNLPYITFVTLNYFAQDITVF